MPEISRFYGIVIRMYYDDHNPPHFHALYGDAEAWISINNLALIYGNLPSRALGMVVEWASLHQEELRHNWALLAEEQRPNKIAPLK
jgi:hypothetical protein